MPSAMPPSAEPPMMMTAEFMPPPSAAERPPMRHYEPPRDYCLRDIFTPMPRRRADADAETYAAVTPNDDAERHAERRDADAADIAH